MTRLTSLSLNNQRQFTCCLCMHVRTGTVIYGISQIILQLLFISILVLLAFNPHLLPDDISDKSNSVQGAVRLHLFSVFFRLVPVVSDIHESLSVPTRAHPETRFDKSPNIIDNVEIDNESNRQSNFLYDSGDTSSVHPPLDKQRMSPPAKWRRFSPYIAICVTTFSLAFCCFMVHGAITHQPTHLLPFFFIQVFDLIICIIHIVGFMSSAPELRLILHTKTGPVYIKSSSLTFIALSVSCLLLAYKSYCLGMVWDCYKYLMLNRRGGLLDVFYSDHYGPFSTFWGLLRANRRSSRNHLSTVDGTNDVFGGFNHQIPPVYDQSNDLPKYEDALKIPANAYAPPPYYSPKTDSNSADKTPQDVAPSKPNEPNQSV